MTKGQWIAYDGSDEQLEEMRNAEHGYLVRGFDGKIIGPLKEAFGELRIPLNTGMKHFLELMKVTEYFII